MGMTGRDASEAGAGTPPAEAPLPRVSIVISTFDRAVWLEGLLPSLAALDYPAFEIVVVNGPSTDGTDALLARYAGRIKISRCPEANLSRSRNLGIAAAAGDVVVFIDDDAVPLDPSWLQHLVAPLAADPALGASGGPVLRGDGEDWEFQGRVASDYGELWEPFEAAALGVVGDGHRWVPCVQGNNCAFTRAALLAIGGFDESFTYYLDETDVCLRLARSGRSIVYAPRAIVRHYSAAAAHRRTWHDRNWDVMARSDTYFCLRHGADPLPVRVRRTFALARRKWPYQTIMRQYRQGHYGWRRLVRYLARWVRGMAAGLWLGLRRRRHTPLGPEHEPFPFLDYCGS